MAPLLPDWMADEKVVNSADEKAGVKVGEKDEMKAVMSV